MKFVAMLLSVFLLFAIWPQTAITQAQQKPEDLAQKSGEAWLALTDSGKYPESWQEASTAFKAAVTQDQWVSALTGVRTPLGKVLSRKLKNATYTKTLPGAPDGEYVVMQFTTSFENKKDSVETVTFTVDKDTKWRAAGYFIK